MRTRHGAIALAIVGLLLLGAAGFLLTGLRIDVALPTAGIAAVYVAAGVWSFLARDRDATHVRVLLPVAAAFLVLLGLLWFLTGSLLEPTRRWRTALLLATLTVAFAFPLGLATARRHRRITAGLAALAVAPLLAVGWVLGTGTPPDEQAFLLSLAVPLGLVLLGLALPLYLEARAIARAVTGAAPDPVLPRALATALTGVLVAATVNVFRLEARLSTGTTAGSFSLLRNPIAVAVVLVVLVAFVGSVLRLGRSLSGSGAAG